MTWSRLPGALAAIAGLGMITPALADEADLVLHNAAVYTVDGTRSWAQAVAVTDGRITYVGNDRDARALAGASTEVIDLGGRMLLPGFQDAHAHPASSGTGFLACPLYEGDTSEDYLALVRACLGRQPDKAVVSGEGWKLDAFPNGLPDKRPLDELAPDRAVILTSADGHSVWLNSTAMRLAGIGPETPDPVNGRIDRYPGTREPSGSLQESAMNLAYAVVPTPSAADYAAALQFSETYFNQYGVTAAVDASISLGDGGVYATSAAYQAAAQADDLSLRVIGALRWDETRGLEQVEELVAARERLRAPRFTPNTIKFFLDGVIEAHTAAMLEPYIDRTDEYRGEIQIDPAVLQQAAIQLDARGFQLHFHAIGDRAIRVAFDAIEAVRETNGVRDNRPVLTHIQVFEPGDIQRFRELNAIANFQPYWAWADPYITDLTIPKLGEERSRWLYPIGSVFDTGAVVAFGSDWAVSSGNPMLGIETAITRREPETGAGGEFYDSERIRLHEAIAAYTINSAYANFLDADTGSIEVGKLADLVVLDRNLFAIEVGEISEAEVLVTLLEGEVVFGGWDFQPQPKNAE